MPENIEHSDNLSFAELNVTNLSIFIRALELSLELISCRLSLVTSTTCARLLKIFLELSQVQGADVLTADICDLLYKVLVYSLTFGSMARSK